MGNYEDVYNGTNMVAENLASNGSWIRGEVYAGAHLATYVNGTTYFSHKDWLGSERVRSDVSGNIVETCTGNPYGDSYTCAGADPSPVKYAGMEYDTETQLYHTQFRYYNPRLGGWMTPDPMGMAASNLDDPQSFNRYTYTLNDPVNMLDPTGGLAVCAWSGTLWTWGQFQWIDGLSIHCFGLDNGSGCKGKGCVDKPDPTGNKRTMTLAQCRAAYTLLEREAKYGTTVAAWQSAIGFGDGTVEPFNSSNPGTAYTNTAAGVVKVDWFTDLRITGLIPGPQVPAYIGGKLMWTGIRLKTGLKITNYLPFQDPVETRTMALAAGGYGFRSLFTPEFMKANCGLY